VYVVAILKSNVQYDMKLTVKQERFAQDFILHGDATKAFKHAFNTSKMKPYTINSRAYDMKQKVQSRIEELQNAILDDTILSFKEIASLLSDRVRTGLDQDGLRAVDILNKMRGYYSADNNQKSEPKQIIVKRLD